MGRKKQFDDAEILHQAMMQFWQFGYAATTYGQLEQLTGLTGRSLINAFGDKDALFDKVLERYRQMVESELAMQFKSPGVAAIQQFFATIANSPTDGPRQFGCLICNTIFESNDREEQVSPHVTSFKDCLSEAFYQSLLADNIQYARRRAIFLLNYFWGSVVEIRRQARPAANSLANEELQILLMYWQSEKTA